MMFFWLEDENDRRKESNMNSEAKITALYERLSHDDELQGESNSIASQNMFLESYARKNGFLNPRYWHDDEINVIRSSL
jgi:hypothetical protein